jgi:hypothetical protein
VTVVAGCDRNVVVVVSSYRRAGAKRQRAAGAVITKAA